MSEKIKIVCPSCQAKLGVPKTLIGQTRNCPKCKVPFLISVPIVDAEIVECEVVEATDLASDGLDLGLPLEGDDLFGTPVQPVSASPNPKATFQKKLAKHRGQKVKGLSRREKLTRARTQPSKEETEFDWGTAGWGIGLIILAFVSCAMPGADEIRGGRGIIGLLSRVLFALGPYAPMFGLLFGLGGVGLIAMAAKGVARIPVYIGGGVVGVILLVACLGSFLGAMGMFDGMSGRAVASSNARHSSSIAESRNRHAEEFRKSKEQFEAEFAAQMQNHRFPSTDTSRNAIPQPPSVGGRSPFEPNFGGQNSKTENDNPFGDVEDFDPANPFADAEAASKRSRSQRGSQANRGAQRGALRGSKPNGRASAPTESPTSSVQFRDPFERARTRIEFAKRFGRGKSLGVIKIRSFDDSSLELGPSVGAESPIGRVFYDSQPIKGIAFFADSRTYLLPSWDDMGDQLSSIAKQGEGLFGFNVNFRSGEIVGVQAIFAGANGNDLDASNLSVGSWLGEAPDGDNYETVDNGGKPIYGISVGQRGADAINIQLVIKK